MMKAIQRAENLLNISIHSGAEWLGENAQEISKLSCSAGKTAERRRSGIMMWWRMASGWNLAPENLIMQASKTLEAPHAQPMKRDRGREFPGT